MAPRKRPLGRRYGMDTPRSVFSMRLKTMVVTNKLKRALRGEVNLRTAAREAFRRTYTAALSRRERAALGHEKGLELKRQFSAISREGILTHFRNKTPIRFFWDLNPCPSDFHLVDSRRDPKSGYEWPLD